MGVLRITKSMVALPMEVRQANSRGRRWGRGLHSFLDRSRTILWSRKVVLSLSLAPLSAGTRSWLDPLSTLMKAPMVSAGEISLKLSVLPISSAELGNSYLIGSSFSHRTPLVPVFLTS